MTKHVLVTGGAGQVGLSMQALGNDALVLHTPDRKHLDLMSDVSIRDAVFSRQWSGVINAAAYTAVDKAESDKDIAWHVNAVAPGILAQACAQAKVPLVHISTDYVFSGELGRPYVEDDPVGPINVYGASKEAGENAVRSACESHIIIRTSWVVSAWRSNFLKTILRLSFEREQLRVVADQTGHPTSAHDLARASADDCDLFRFTKPALLRLALFDDGRLQLWIRGSALARARGTPSHHAAIARAGD